MKSKTEKDEKHKIEKALIKNKFNRTKTSASLGISRKTLYNKIKKHNL
jgi:transcriptional regulator with PAS, ATPase and Fis domain